MDAYSTRRRHMGRIDDLIGRAASGGLGADAVREALGSDRYAQAVRDDEAEAARYGAQGAPPSAIDSRFGVSDAQRPEEFAQIARHTWAERQKPLAWPDGSELVVPSLRHHG